jgi:hypothetical protein
MMLNRDLQFKDGMMVKQGRSPRQSLNLDECGIFPKKAKPTVAHHLSNMSIRFSQLYPEHPY